MKTYQMFMEQGNGLGDGIRGSNWTDRDAREARDRIRNRNNNLNRQTPPTRRALGNPNNFGDGGRGSDAANTRAPEFNRSRGQGAINTQRDRMIKQFKRDVDAKERGHLI